MIQNPKNLGIDYDCNQRFEGYADKVVSKPSHVKVNDFLCLNFKSLVSKTYQEFYFATVFET